MAPLAYTAGDVVPRRIRSPAPEPVRCGAQRAFNLPFAILVAWLLTRTRFAGRTLFDAFVHLPLVLPPVVVGYLLLVLFGVRGPIGGWLYEHFGIQLAFTSTGAALATAVMSFPLVVRSIRIALEGLDRGLEEAARTLGAGPSTASSPSRCR